MHNHFLNFDIHFRTNSTDNTEIKSNVNNDNNHNENIYKRIIKLEKGPGR